MSISVNKCSYIYIYAAHRKVSPTKRSNSSNLLLGIGPTIFGDPPYKQMRYIQHFAALYYSKLSHYTHSYL